MSAVQDEVVTMFQNIVKLKLRTWLQKNKYISRMLATLLVPDGDKFREETIDERTAFFANVIDLDNDTDASMVEEVIDHFFMRSGVSGTITPQSSVSLKKT
jgi:regulator of RNase E activity RraA